MKNPNILYIRDDGTLFCVDGQDPAKYLAEWKARAYPSSQGQTMAVNIIEHNNLNRIASDAEMFQYWAS